MKVAAIWTVNEFMHMLIYLVGVQKENYHMIHIHVALKRPHLIS